MGSHVLHRGWLLLIGLIYAGFFTYYTYDSIKHPYNNVDMFFYAAIIDSGKDGNTTRAYKNAVERIKSTYSDRSVHMLTKENPVTSDEKAFIQQFPYYKLKPLYLAGVYVLGQVGIDLHVATYIVAAMGFFAIGLLGFLFRPRGLDPGIWWLMLIGFAFIGRTPLVELAAYSTPDTLCVALILFALLLFVHGGSLIGFFCLALLAQLARPDTMLLVVFLIAFFAVIPGAPKRPKLPVAIAMIAVSIAVYFGMNKLVGAYSWPILFSHSFLGRVPYPAEFVPMFGVKEYLGVFFEHAPLMMQNATILTLLSASLVTVFLNLVRPMHTKWYAYLLIALWVSLATRFVIYPSWWEDRYYFPHYLLMLYAIASGIAPYIMRGKKVDA